MKNNWLNRTTKKLEKNVSPGDMAKRYRELFTDALGKPVSTDNWIYDPDLSAVNEVPSIFWVITNDVVSEMSQTEKDNIILSGLEAARDAKIQEQVDDMESVLRQVVISIVNETNILREWVTEFKTKVSTATSLNDLKTNIAELPDLQNRTIEQIKNKLRSTLGS